ncbi:MAG: PQQ-binding-like beta-propeller repeat protein [Actinomycetes bacterium]
MGMNRSTVATALVAIALVAAWAMPPPVAAAAARGPAGPAARWVAPLVGEPVGLALDGSDVAVLASGEVRLLDAATGAVRWIADTPDAFDVRPALGANRVAVTGDDVVVLLDRSTGARVATPRFPDAGPVSLGVSPDGHAWAVVAAEEAGRVGLLDSTTGAEAWSVPFPASFWAAPALSGDIVVAGGSGRDGVLLRGLDLATGSIRWEVRPGAVGSAPLVAGGRIYVAAGPTPSRARVRALDVTTGRRLWSTAVPGRYDGGIQPGVDGSRLLVLDSLGTLVALDTTTGRVDWVLPTHHDVVEGRVATGAGVAAFTTYLDEVAEVDTATGAVLDAWRPAGVPVDLVVGPGVLVEALRLADPARVAAVTLARRRP